MRANRLDAEARGRVINDYGMRYCTSTLVSKRMYACIFVVSPLSIVALLNIASLGSIICQENIDLILPFLQE
jgi:hypothetical protein